MVKIAHERDHGHSKADWRADDYTVPREFEDEGRAIQWLIGAGLAEFNDVTARGEVWSGGNLIWNRANLQTRENRESDRVRHATRWLAGLNITGEKSHRLKNRFSSVVSNG